MVLMVISFLLFLLGVLLFFKPRESNRIDCWIAIVVALFLIFIFPYGKDAGAYVMVFERASSLSDSAIYHMQRNFGFNILMLIVKLFTDNYVIYRVVFNGLTIGLIGSTIFKFSKNKSFSWFLFLTSGVFVIYYGSAVRQCMAMAIFIFGYFHAYLSKKYILYGLSIILSFSFHEIGLIGILPMIMDCLYQKIGSVKKYVGITITLAIVGYLVMTFGMPLLFDVFGSDSVITHGLLYFKDGSFSLAGLLLRILIIILYGGLYYLTNSKLEDDSMDFQILNAFYGAFLIYICFADFSLMSRAADYIGILELIYLPNMLMKLKPKMKVVTLTVILVLYGYLACVDMREQSKLLKDTSGLHYPIVMVWQTEDVYAIMEGNYD